MDRRRERARSFLKGLDAILLVSRHNITHISGYTGTDAAYLYTQDRAYLFVDSRNTLQARGETGDEVVQVRSMWEDMRGVFEREGIGTLGIESNVLTVDSFMRLKDLYRGVEMTPLGAQLRYLRAVKDARELAAIRKAVSISEQALEAVLSKGLEGRSEAEVAFDLEWEMRSRGASAVSFELIVASGPRSAMPHGTASPRVIGPDEAVIIDFGCTCDGYCSDQTVTVLTGRPPDGFEEAYRAVHEAQVRAIKAAGPGVRASDLDRIARDHLASRGFDAFFGHGLGHGVGMEVHEAPTVSGPSEDILEEGMVITVEPGVYFDTRFGIRLEDMVVITDNSCKSLTNIDKGVVRIVSKR